MLRFGGLSKFVVSMKLFRVFFVFLLLGGDYGLDPASLEAFPQQHYGCDGRANLLCAPIEPFLLRRLPTGGITLLVLVVTIALKRVSVFRPAMTCFKHWLVRNTQISVINQNPSVHFFLEQNCHCCFKGDSMFVTITFANETWWNTSV